MLDHLGVNVSDLERSKAFYETALEPLGYSFFGQFENAIGFQRDNKPNFWIREAAETAPAHFAFYTKERATVDAFHEAATKAGGTDNGGPGVREIYHPNYYGAFVLDPDGHNVEAVCHRPAEDAD